MLFERSGAAVAGVFHYDGEDMYKPEEGLEMRHVSNQVSFRYPWLNRYLPVGRESDTQRRGE